MITLLTSDNNVGIVPTIECIGDSLTNGTGANPYTMPQQLAFALKSGRLINNRGIGGQTMQQIAARQGGLPLQITVSGNAFAGTGAISVTSMTSIVNGASQTNQFLSTAADNTTRYMSGTVCGVQCYITRTAAGGPPSTSETYTITPALTSTATIPSNSIFYPDEGFNARNCIQIFWIGRNNVPILTGLDTIIDQCISQMKRPRRFIVIGVLNAYTETTGTSNNNAIVAMNAILAANYTGNFVPATPPTAAEMLAIGFTPTTQDNTDIANGVFPTSMKADAVHLNSLGYLIFANRVASLIGNFHW